MALIVLDDSTIGVSPAPGGGFALQLRDITGFPEGLIVMIPFEGEVAEQVYEQAGEALGKNPASGLSVATPAQAQQEAARHHGLHTTE